MSPAQKLAERLRRFADKYGDGLGYLDAAARYLEDTYTNVNDSEGDE
jgi:hypothetical protein